MVKDKVKKAVFRVVRVVGRIIYRKHIWLVSDREFQAGDNGEAFFIFLQEKPVNSVFAISKNSEDYVRMSRIGNVVDYGSLYYKFLLCVSDAHISSQLLHMENHEETYQIFLQHGVIGTDISQMLNPVSHNKFYMITSAKAEMESCCGEQYTIIPDHLWLTGLPRHDRLQNRTNKKITISLTWRKYLVGVNAERFAESNYYKAYKKILDNDKLVSRLKEYGYTLCLKLHPEMEHFKNTFSVAEGIEFWDAPYKDIFAESELLITDYSSIAFDFAQLRKPVIYFQFDADEFWLGEHNYSKGYFDYVEDGFGEVVKTYDELEQKMFSYVEAGCKLKDKYLNRITEFFAYNDKNNSERVYQKIQELLKQ